MAARKKRRERCPECEARRNTLGVPPPYGKFSNQFSTFNFQLKKPSGFVVIPHPSFSPYGEKSTFPSGKAAPWKSSYRIRQISPLQPSLIILLMVSCNLSLASCGIRLNLVCRPSFTSSCRDFPKILDSQIFVGSSSNSSSR